MSAVSSGLRKEKSDPYSTKNAPSGNTTIKCRAGRPFCRTVPRLAGAKPPGPKRSALLHDSQRTGRRLHLRPRYWLEGAGACVPMDICVRLSDQTSHSGRSLNSIADWGVVRFLRGTMIEAETGPVRVQALIWGRRSSQSCPNRTHPIVGRTPREKLCRAETPANLPDATRRTVVLW